MSGGIPSSLETSFHIPSGIPWSSDRIPSSVEWVAPTLHAAILMALPSDCQELGYFALRQGSLCSLEQNDRAAHTKNFAREAGVASSQWNYHHQKEMVTGRSLEDGVATVGDRIQAHDSSLPSHSC